MNYEEFFPARLAELRLKENISAREMSLALELHQSNRE